MIHYYFILGLASFLLIIVVTGVVMHFVFLTDLVFGGHDFATSTTGIKKVGSILKQFKKDKGVLYDFGSARGGFVIGLLKQCPGLFANGIDSSRLRTRASKILSWVYNRKANFFTSDIFVSNVSSADTVYIYLDQSLMSALESKLQKELKAGAMVITNTQHLPNWPLVQSFITHVNKPDFEKMFVYIKS